MLGKKSLKMLIKYWKLILPILLYVNTAKHEPLGAIAKLETPDDDYKETGARNRI